MMAIMCCLRHFSQDHQLLNRHLTYDSFFVKVLILIECWSADVLSQRSPLILILFDFM